MEVDLHTNISPIMSTSRKQVKNLWQCILPVSLFQLGHKPQFLFGNAMTEGLYEHFPTLFIENSKQSGYVQSPNVWRLAVPVTGAAIMALGQQVLFTNPM